MIKVIVVYGGCSSEREISIQTGKAVANALQGLPQLEVQLVDLTDDIVSFIHQIQSVSPDVIFNALHGTHGEDGHIQGLFELLKIPYTHSPLKASAIAFDKYATTILLRDAGLPVPHNIRMKGKNILDLLPFQKDKVIKPVCEGSSVGVFMIPAGQPSLGENFNKWHEHDMLVEDYIKGREMTVSVIAGTPIAVTEIQTHHPFFDYSAKYTKGQAAHMLPASLTPEEEQRIFAISTQAYNALGCKGAARIDYIYDGEEFYCIEVNTQPGMTAVSLLPEQMQYKGVSFPQLCLMLIEQAMLEDCREER